METDYRTNLKFKYEYYKLSIQISILRLRGLEPSERLLQEAQNMGHLVGVSKEVLENL